MKSLYILDLLKIKKGMGLECLLQKIIDLKVCGKMMKKYRGMTLRLLGIIGVSLRMGFGMGRASFVGEMEKNMRDSGEMELSKVQEYGNLEKETAILDNGIMAKFKAMVYI